MSNKQSSRRPRSSAKLHQVTFCGSCETIIPARALACFHCGAKQAHGGRTLQVVFCSHCGEDYPERALACFHCGHRNPRHPTLKGRISR